MIFAVDKDSPWDGKYIGEYLQYFVTDADFEDDAVIAAVEDHALVTSDAAVPMFGMTRQKIYGRFHIRSDKERDLLIEIDYAYLNRFSLLQNVEGQWTRKDTGTLHDYSKRDIKARGYVLEIHLKAGLNTFYFKATGENSLQIPLRIWNHKSYYDAESSRNSIIDFIFGGLFLLFLYNLVIYINLKESVYLGYTFYVAALIGYEMVSQGAMPGFVYHFSKLDVKINYLGPIFANLICIAACHFAPVFLELDRKSLINKILILVSIASGIAIMIAPWSTYYSTYLSLVIISVGIPPAFLAGLTKYQESDPKPHIKIYVAAWTIYLLGGSAATMNFMGFIPMSHLTKYGHLISGTIEVSLLSLALVSRIKDYRKAIYDEQRAKAHSYDQLMKVFYPHQLSLIKTGHQLEDTMPTGPGEACVISFDVISSGKIQHEKAKDFFRNVFRHCNEIMAENYDPAQLRGNAYRIKEMGDGFLCSVGYPFKSPTGSMANDALQIAKRFYQAFQEEVDRLGHRDPIHCGIGIAFDTIAGFYPESGTKEYDLFGRAIVLATRYEGMRRQILDIEKPSSIIILQERVLISLDQRLAQEFVEFDLQKNGVVVRDDPSARKLYYQLMVGVITGEKLAS